MHGAWPGIERSVMLPGRFVDLGRIARELVPEAVKIDPFATRDQPFSIGATEGEMPERRTAHDLVPGRNARHRGIHHYQPVGLVTVTGSVRISDHRADIVPDYGCVIDAEMRENGPDVARLRPLIITTSGMPRETHASQIRDNDCVIAHKLR